MEEKNWLIIALDGSWRVVQATTMFAAVRSAYKEESEMVIAAIAVDTLRDCFSEACTHDSITIGEKVIDIDIWNDGDGHVDSNGPYVNHEGFEQWLKEMIESKKPKL